MTGYKFVYGLYLGIVSKVLDEYLPEHGSRKLVYRIWRRTVHHDVFRNIQSYDVPYKRNQRDWIIITIEAAKYGASQSTILFKIILPTMKPTILTITVLTFIAD